MTYEECLSGIHSRKTFSSTASLDRMVQFMERLGNPQDQLRCVHVAGTNGKGSTCALVESALRCGGYKTGLFTSPYLLDFRERIRIDGAMISKAQLISCYEAVMDEQQALEAMGYEPINEFELVTAIGFLAFFRARVEYAVIEVGLGGRCDATNVIKQPAVCCITPISLDHTAVLGDTVEKISEEKSGIMKEGCPVVLARQNQLAMDVLLRKAQSLHAPVVATDVPAVYQISSKGSWFRYGNVDLHTPLMGIHQASNAAMAYEVCRCLKLPEKMIARGFSDVQWPGRLQYFSGNPDILIDAGHNAAGMAALAETLDEYFPRMMPITVMAMMKDKDHARCIPLIARRSKLLIATAVDLARALPPEELAAEAAESCEVETAPSVAAALERAKVLAKPGQLVLVCGSVYAAGEALKAMNYQFK